MFTPAYSFVRQVRIYNTDNLGDFLKFALFSCLHPSKQEIISSYAQGAIKAFPRMLSIAVHVKTVNIFPLAEHTRIFVWCMISVRWNRFLVCSVCDKTVSAYAQHAHAIIFENYSKIPNYKNTNFYYKKSNFKKPLRNPSNRTQVNILKKKLFG